jgi:hypothetical protein
MGGHANPWGALLFVSGEVLLAIGVVAFFVGVVRLSSSVRAARIWGRLAALAGITVALALVAAGFTPANRFLSFHVEAALIAFRGAAVAAAFLAVAIAQDRRFPRLTIAVAVVIAVVLAGYAGVIQWGGPESTTATVSGSRQPRRRSCLSFPWRESRISVWQQIACQMRRRGRHKWTGHPR